VGGTSSCTCRKASKNLGLKVPCYVFSGAWRAALISTRGPSGQNGLVEAAFKELAQRWKPILDVFDEKPVLMPASKYTPARIFTTGASSRYSRSIERASALQSTLDPSHFILQQLDYLEYIDSTTRDQDVPRQGLLEFNPLAARVSMAASSRG